MTSTFDRMMKDPSFKKEFEIEYKRLINKEELLNKLNNKKKVCQVKKE